MVEGAAHGLRTPSQVPRQISQQRQRMCHHARGGHTRMTGHDRPSLASLNVSIASAQQRISTWSNMRSSVAQALTERLKQLQGPYTFVVHEDKDGGLLVSQGSASIARNDYAEDGPFLHLVPHVNGLIHVTYRKPVVYKTFAKQIPTSSEVDLLGRGFEPSSFAGASPAVFEEILGVFCQELIRDHWSTTS